MNPIKPKRSFTPSAVPVASSDISGAGELLINWADGKFFTKDTSGNLVTLTVGGAGGGGSLSGSVTIPASGDPLWSNTRLLLNGDGNLTDSSLYARVVTANGSATTSTSQKKYGSGSLSFNGASGSYISPPTSSDWAFSGDFTVEGWAWLDATAPQYAGILTSVEASSNPGGLIIASDKVFLSANSFGAENGVSWTFPTESWAHFAVVNDSGTLRIYLNGVQQGSTAKTITLSSTTMYIGSRFTNLQQYNWKGYVDDLRITTACRYPNGTTFTPPTATYATGFYTPAQTLPVVFS